MKFEKLKILYIGLFYFFILLGMALWVRDIPNQPDAVHATIDDIIRTSRMGDPKSFATGAIDVAENGWISKKNDWIFNLWPPGFILLEAFILKFFGFDAPIILILQFLSVGLFTVVLTLLFTILNISFKKHIAFFLPLFIFVFPVSRVFLLQPTGLTLGEGFAIGFFLIGVMVALFSLQKSIYYAFISGFSFALAAYFRPQFEIIFVIMTGCGILLLVIIISKRIKALSNERLNISIIRSVIVILVVGHLSMIPWRIYHQIQQGSPLWVYTSNLTFRNSVLSSDDLRSMGGGFVVAGGGNLTCRINPEACGNTADAKKLFIQTFLSHPLQWYAIKLGLIGSYWFSSVKNWAGVGVSPVFMDYFTNTLLLFAIVAVFSSLLIEKVRSHEYWIFLVWFCASLLMAYALIITVTQFEVRYFYFPKIVGIMMFLIVISLYFRQEETHQL